MNDLMLQNSQLRRHYLITSGTSLIAVIIPRIIRLTAAYVGYDCDAFDLHKRLFYRSIEECNLIHTASLRQDSISRVRTAALGVS